MFSLKSTHRINTLEQELSGLKASLEQMSIDRVEIETSLKEFQGIKRALLESESRNRGFFYDNNCIILLINPDSGEIVDANPAACKYYGYAREEVCRMNISAINTLSREEILAEMQNAKDEKRKHFYFKHRLANSEIRDVEVYSGPVQFGEAKLLYSIVHDVTERMTAENEIRELNATLEQKISQRTAQLSLTNDELLNEVEERKKAENEITKARIEAERANQAKSEFLSRISHELRTPLNSILGFAQLLEMGNLEVKQRKGINHILNSGKHLLELINEVLDISRVEEGLFAVSKEPIQLLEVIQETTDILLTHALSRQISITLIDSDTNLLFVKSDKQRLKQILLNLISNAVKFNIEGGLVMIRTEIKMSDSQGIAYIRISVSDTGAGIEKGNIPKLFRPFERIGTEQKAMEGPGLGLAMVKKLVDSMDGNLGVESTVNQGSTFWFEIPYYEYQSNVLTNPVGLDEKDLRLSQKSGLILYIEDDPTNTELVNQIMNIYRPGIELISDSRGKATLDLAIEQQPDLILLDLNLPDIHGADVLSLLKTNEKTCWIPVVVISADAMPKTREELLKTGAKKFLTKPLDIKELVAVMDEYVPVKLLQ